LEKESLAFKLSMLDQLGSDRTYNQLSGRLGARNGRAIAVDQTSRSHFGGTQNAIAISWPKRIKARGEIRSQFQHVTDIVPTILEATGIQARL
jgi:arylsulfatase